MNTSLTAVDSNSASSSSLDPRQRPLDLGPWASSGKRMYPIRWRALPPSKWVPVACPRGPAPRMTTSSLVPASTISQLGQYRACGSALGRRPPIKPPQRSQRGGASALSCTCLTIGSNTSSARATGSTPSGTARLMCDSLSCPEAVRALPPVRQIGTFAAALLQIRCVASLRLLRWLSTKVPHVSNAREGLTLASVVSLRESAAPIGSRMGDLIRRYGAGAALQHAASVAVSRLTPAAWWKALELTLDRVESPFLTHPTTVRARMLDAAAMHPHARDPRYHLTEAFLAEAVARG